VTGRRTSQGRPGAVCSANRRLRRRPGRHRRVDASLGWIRSRSKAPCSICTSMTRAAAHGCGHTARAAASTRASSGVTVSFMTTASPQAVMHPSTSLRNPLSSRLPPSSPTDICIPRSLDAVHVGTALPRQAGPLGRPPLAAIAGVFREVRGSQSCAVPTLAWRRGQAADSHGVHYCHGRLRSIALLTTLHVINRLCYDMLQSTAGHQSKLRHSISGAPQQATLHSAQCPLHTSSAPCLYQG
jgi:hypothetical protein